MNHIFSFIRLITSHTAKHTYFIFLGNFSSMAFSLAFTVLVGRMLSLSDSGYFTALVAFILLTSDIADIGIGSSLSRFLPTMEHTPGRLHSFYKTAFLIQFFVGVGITLGLFLNSSQINQWMFNGSIPPHLLEISILGILGSILFNFFLNSLLARQRFIVASSYTAISGLLRIIFILCILFFIKFSVYHAVWIQVLSMLIPGVIGLFLVHPAFLQAKTTKGDVRQLLNFAKYLAVARALTALAGKLDVIMLLSLSNSLETGVYGLAARLTTMYPLLSGSFGNVLAPKIAGMKSKQEVKNYMFKIILATLGLIGTIVVGMILASPILTVLYGVEKGAAMVSVFRLLLISMMFFVGSIPPVMIAIYYIKKPVILTINSILQVIIVIAGNFLLIPLYGNVGAAVTQVLAFSITLVLTTIMTIYFFRLHHE